MLLDFIHCLFNSNITVSAWYGVFMKTHKDYCFKV